MPVTFRVVGPHEIHSAVRKGGRVITSENVTTFWNHHEQLAEEKGCYVFGIRSGRGIMPWYVGKATRNFRSEVFQPHKLHRYWEAMMEYGRGTPVVFFVVYPRSRGQTNGRAISECERQLIQLAARTNPDVTNIVGTKPPMFVVPHVTDAARGRPSHAALELCRAFGLELRDPAQTVSPSKCDSRNDGNELLQDALAQKTNTSTG